MAIITTDKATERVGRKINGSTKKYADEKSRAEINKIFTDGAYQGQGIAVCSTAATTAAKTVTLANYLLLKNTSVCIRFQYGVNVANATLNINSQGAKPILIDGAALQPGVIRPGMTVILVYDGTNFNIVSLMGQEQSTTQSDLYVDMGLPSGLLWAKANIDISTDSGFQEVDGAISPFKYECSFCSWGNTEMHNPSSTSAFAYNWGGVNSEEPWYYGQVYGSTPGNKLTANISPSFDAARVNLGAPWRMPTTTEYAELFANIDYVQADGTTVIGSSTTDKRVTVNGITGLYLKSKTNSNLLFFACSGHGHGTTWYSRGGSGYYWSSSFYDARYARRLNFYSGGVSPQSYDNRYCGFAVRPVQ